MNYQEKYQKALQAGYSDEEIMQYLGNKNPEFEQKVLKAQEAGYTPQEVLSYFNKPNENKEQEQLNFGEYAKDFGKQAAQGLGIGALGTYGDILDLLGIQAKQALPAQQAKSNREFNTLDKIEKGSIPSVGELVDLSGDDDILPSFSRLSSSQDIKELGKDLNLVSEPKTAAGRYGRRIGQIGGGGASLGTAGIISPIVAGAAGQTLEELGAPPWAQAAAEIIATLKLSPKSTQQISSKSADIENVIKDLRKAGYSEKDITLAKNALEERKLLKKYATLTPEAENSINQGLKNSEELLKQQIKKGLPTYAEGGIPALEREASNIYQSMEELASNVPVTNKQPVKASIENAISYLEKYPLLDEQKKFIEFLKDGLTKLDKADTAEFFTGFYRNLGKAGNWGDPKQKEHLLGLVKQGIKNTFQESGKEAAEFGRVFEKTNETWIKWLQSRDLMQALEKAQSVDGTNFKKLSSILNDPKNNELSKKILTPEVTKNIKTISEGSQAIESLLKQIPKNNKDIQSLKYLEGIRAVLTGDYRPLASLIGMEAAKRWATTLLFDPDKQNRMMKLIVAAKNNAPQQAGILAQELIKDSVPATKEERQLR